MNKIISDLVEKLFNEIFCWMLVKNCWLLFDLYKLLIVLFIIVIICYYYFIYKDFLLNKIVFRIMLDKFIVVFFRL